MATMKDIAREAGVSHATVSFVLNGKATKIKISDETALKVKAIAASLGYSGNDIARALVTGKTNVIGFLTSTINHEYVSIILAAAMERAAEYNFYIKLITWNENTTANDILKVCERQKLSALICTSFSDILLTDIKIGLDQLNIPLATVSSSHFAENKNIIQSHCNNYQGGALAAEFLYKLGHRKLAHITSNLNSLYAVERKKGFFDKITELGLKIEEKYCFGSFVNEKIIDYVNRIFRNRMDVPTAIFCAGDYHALIVLTTLQQMGYKIPDDISIVGYGDMSFAHFSNPGITSIKEPYNEVGRWVVDRMIGPADLADGELKKLIDVKLVERNSTAKLCSKRRAK